MNTTCVSPPELDDRTLLMYLDGEADPEVAEHIAACRYCSERALRLARAQERLLAHLYRATCPSPLELGEYHSGTLDEVRAEAIAQHVAECPHCAQEIAQLAHYLDTLASSLQPNPLAQVARQAQVWIARLVDGVSGAGARPQPALAPAFAGLRGGDEGPRVYQVNDVQIVIEVEPDVDQPDRSAILGLVTGLENVRDFEAHLWQAEQPVAKVPIDELGNFIISDIGPGSYELILGGSESEIHIQAIEVGAS